MKKKKNLRERALEGRNARNEWRSFGSENEKMENGNKGKVCGRNGGGTPLLFM